MQVIEFVTIEDATKPFSHRCCQESGIAKNVEHIF